MLSPAVLADVVVAFHFGYLLFTVGGEVLILFGALVHWKWIRAFWFRILHLASVAIVAVEALIGYLCPLTQLEHHLRTVAGQNVDADISFVGRLIRSILFYDFPSWFFTCLYIGFGVVVLLTFIFIPPRRKKTR